MKNLRLGPQTRQAADWIERHLKWTEGFWLGFVFTIEPPQAHFLQAQASETLAAFGREQRVLRPRTPGELEGILAQVLATRDCGCTWVEAIRERDAASGGWTEAWIHLILRANERRELLRESLGGGLVFVAHPDLKADFRTAAPDLWSIRSRVFELAPGPGIAESTASRAMFTERVAGRVGGRVDTELLDEDVRRATVLGNEPLGHRARGLFRLGNRLHAAGRYEEALAATQEAVEYYRELTKEDPDTFLPELAKVLNNLGSSQNRLGRREPALLVTQEALEIWRTLAGAHPDAFLGDLAMSLTNLGDILSQLGRHEEALIVVQDAAELCRNRVKERPEALSQLAMALDGLGNQLGSMGRSEEALAATREALKHYREIVSSNPDAFLPDLARTLVNFGMRLWSLGRLEEAQAATQEGLEHYRELSNANPDAFLPEVARCLGALGSIQRERGDLPASLSAFGEALRILEPFARAVPEAFNRHFQLLVHGLRATCEEGGLTPPSDLQPLLEKPESVRPPNS